MVEVVELGREALRDVGVAELLADHRGVLAFGQGIVVGAPGVGLGEVSDMQLVEQGGDLVVDVFGAVIGVEALVGKDPPAVFSIIARWYR